MYVHTSGFYLQAQEAIRLQHLVPLTALTGLTELTSNAADPDYMRDWEFAFHNRVSIASGWRAVLSAS
jgi:hypothetical protein